MYTLFENLMLEDKAPVELMNLMLCRVNIATAREKNTHEIPLSVLIKLALL